jgi:hypothetical protein
MKIFVAVALGEYTETCNGEEWKGSRAAPLKAFRTYQEGAEFLRSNPPLPGDGVWGVTGIDVQECELVEGS